MAMTGIARLAGILLLGYAGLYTAYYIFDTLHDPGSFWPVFNVLSAIGIVVALGVNIDHARTRRDALTIALLYATVVLAIWFFRNWVHLLALEPGEAVNAHTNVIWMLIAVLIPLVLGTTGWRLWRTP